MKVFLGTILLLGCLQGIVSCVLLFRSKRHRQANRLLGALILVITLATLRVYGNDEGWWDKGLVLILVGNFVPFFLVMAAGPLAYLYVRACLDPRFVFRKRDRIHFVPVLLDLVPVITVCIYVVLLAFGRVKPGGGAWGNFIDSYNVYVDIPRWISVTVYVLAGWKMLKGAPDSTRWIRHFLTGLTVFQVIWLINLIPYEFPASGNWMLDHLDWYPLYIPMTVLSYWLGIKGYLSSQLMPVSGALLTKTMAQQTIRTLEKIMKEDKAYRNPDLNLAQLAKQAGVPTKTVSTVLNQHLGQSVNEYINGYRIKEVQEKLLEGGARERTIAGLAYESGFNSLPTFQRAFKAISGVSPKEFLIKSGIE
ncbi:helix-turn-helix domain-containing protein [Dinghuibacter silviterrae]|uniref:AraC-like DNA-binding protein n=1 Tax=Dinghuibacter silviterrae TaxID=1539049 RepID=A0A4R8DH91_9BACT|nr:helix-turn-helix domain-containing protein [Dinghuibacter silviterrae]TDW96604.1 AraC-like DNA-binding protein [Dinghuibacter silviterrae]